MRLKNEGWHSGSSNTGSNRVFDVVIGYRSMELSAGKIDTRDIVAIGPMAQRALRHIQFVAGLNIRSTVLLRRALSRGPLGNTHTQDNTGYCRDAHPPVTAFPEIRHVPHRPFRYLAANGPTSGLACVL